MAKDKYGTVKPTVGIDSHHKHPERDHGNCVQGEANLCYGEVSGFREGITSTGYRHKETPLGKRARGG